MTHTAPRNFERENRRWWIWPAIVVTLLTVHTTGMLFAVSIANRDRSFKVDPDYYRKGLTLDARKAQMATSDKLGWIASVSADRSIHATSARTVAVKLVDREGNAITGATIDISFYHHARGSDVRTLTLKESATPGEYSADTDLAAVGFWQFDLVVKRGSDTFLKTIDAQYVR